MMMMRDAVVIERSGGNCSACLPDRPGCVATGGTAESAAAEIRGAIRFHIEGLEADGEIVPRPASRAHHVEAR